MASAARRVRTSFLAICLAVGGGGPALAVYDDLAFGRLDEPVIAQADPIPRVDPARLKQAIEAYRRGEIAEGDRIRSGLVDPAARTLTEWVAIRSGASLGFSRIAAFLRAEDGWPAGMMLRRRAEETLFYNRERPETVRAFFAAQRPTTPHGKLALALAFQADGLDEDAAALVREAWRRDIFGVSLEARYLAAFDKVLTEADHRARMERALLKESWAMARRMAALAGKDYKTLVDARVAVAERSRKAKAVLDKVPARLRTDSSYLFSRAQMLRREDKADEAAKVIADAPRDPEILADGDEWWTERRLIARQLLDKGDAKAAYEVVRAHSAQSDAQEIEAEFHAGWILLRFLDDPNGAAAHFAKAAREAGTPISVSRIAYWQGRAAEAAGDAEGARAHYTRAAAHPIAYYGQLARAKLGDAALPLRSPADPAAAERETFERLGIGRALRLLYAMDARDLALALYADLGQRLDDPGHLKLVGDLAAEHRDARGLLALGKSAVQRGFKLDDHAYPTLGIPPFEPVGERIERAMVYAIARQESAFDPRARSSVGARGLMQLMPGTAKETAKRFGLDYDLERLLSDPAYNATLGSAYLGGLMNFWKGSYILAFASYNAGAGNVRKWVAAYGDPREPDVDPIDWVERIPFSETRNYVQRVFENMQVYRQRLGERTAILTENDLRRAGSVQ